MNPLQTMQLPAATGKSASVTDLEYNAARNTSAMCGGNGSFPA